MSYVRIQRKGTITLPTAARQQLGLGEGDLLNVKVRATSIVITPQLVIDRSKFPTANDDYTPEQRRRIDAELAQSFDDVKHGRVKTFNTHEEMLAHLHSGDARQSAKVSRAAKATPKKIIKPKSR